MNDSLPTLIDVLSGRGDKGRRLADRIAGCVRPAAGAIMPQVVQLFPQYTPHALPHLDAVARNLDWIIPPDVVEHLDDYELYFVLAAAYLHDIGMVLAIPNPPAGADFDDFLVRYAEAHPGASDDAGVAEYVRREHHLRSEKYIGEHWDKLGLGPNAQEWKIVARIAAGHRVERLDSQRFTRLTFTAGGPHMIHRDLLAAYLRLADECDITHERTPSLALETAGVTDTVSLMHWRTHLSVTGIGPHKHGLEISARCTDYDVHLALLDVTQKLRDTLDEVRDQLPEAYPLCPNLVVDDPVRFTTVRADIEAEGYKAWRVRFDLDAKRVAEMLSSSAFYRHPHAPVRELLQNSLDACHLRARLARGARAYVPAIEIRTDPWGGAPTLVVSDNGYGMSESVVTRYLGRVGRSFYRSQEFSELGTSFSPISQHGIGLLSAFMLGDAMTIRTKREGHDGMSIDIRDLTSFFRVSPWESTHSGTEVELKLRKPIDSDLADIVRHFVRCADVPITVRDGQSVSVVPSNGELAFDWAGPFQEHLGTQMHWLATRHRVDEFLALVVEAQLPGCRARLNVIVPDPHSMRSLSVFEVPDVVHTVVCNQGIFVETGHPQQPDLPPGVSTMGYLNFLAHPDNLTLARDSFVGDALSPDFATALADAVLDVVGQHCAAVAAANDLPIVNRRSYVHKMVLYRLTGSAPGVVYRPEVRSHIRDKRLPGIYGSSYLFAVKKGNAACLRTLDAIASRCPQASLWFCLADLAAPNFNGFDELERGRNVTVVIDDPEEFNLARAYLARRGFTGELSFLSAWDMWQASGAELVEPVVSNAFPAATVVVRSQWGVDDMAKFVGGLDDLPSLQWGDEWESQDWTEWASEHDDPILMWNYSHPLVNTIAVTSWTPAEAESLRSLLELLCRHMINRGGGRSDLLSDVESLMSQEPRDSWDEDSFAATLRRRGDPYAALRADLAHRAELPEVSLADLLDDMPDAPLPRRSLPLVEWEVEGRTARSAPGHWPLSGFGDQRKWWSAVQ